MTLAEKAESHSIEELEELPEKFDIDPELIPDVDYSQPHNISQVIKNVLEDAEGVYTYYWNSKFELHQIERLDIE